MLRRLCLALAFGLAAVLDAGGALAAGAPQFDQPAPNFAAESKSCEQAVQDALKGSPQVPAIVRYVAGALGDNSKSACKTTPPKQVDTAVLLDAVGAAVTDRRNLYRCDAPKPLPVCDGLARVAARVLAMRALLGGDPVTAISADQTGLLHYRNSLQWNADYLTFGTSPTTGASFVRLVLLATPAHGTGLEAKAGPDVAYADFSQALAAPDVTQDACNSDCANRVAEVMALYPLFQALDAAFQPTFLGPEYKHTAQELAVKDQKWNAYHFGGGTQRIQLPWELAVNGLIFNAQRDPKDPFPDPPRWALTFAHPSVGISLKDTKGADSGIVGVVEVVGFSRWSYGGDDNSRKSEWGLSAIAAYQPRSNGDDWGYGVLARLPWQGLNVAWTRARLKAGGNADEVLLSLDVSKYLSGGSVNVPCLFKLPTCKTP